MPPAASLFIAIPILLYLIFLFWYGGRGKPLTQVEVESLLAEMKRRAGKKSQPAESPLLDQFRELTKNDDGREYYMVNLLKFRQKALYPAGSPFDDDPLAANARYSRAILPLLLKHGAHPVFLGQVQGRFLHPVGADDWDLVGIIRYRSRRDMLKMAVEVAGLGVDIHKWAALEKTQVFPVRPYIHIAFVRAAVGVFLLVAAVLLQV
ncbi:MAG: hypothetical protein EHM81_08570 [Chloroflexi bacterium]|nr:MAG: hypothetical protein EHM81_08570 [Chloroflexota bacterium]